jgi:hypothetical protein
VASASGPGFKPWAGCLACSKVIPTYFSQRDNSAVVQTYLTGLSEPAFGVNVHGECNLSQGLLKKEEGHIIGSLIALGAHKM